MRRDGNARATCVSPSGGSTCANVVKHLSGLVVGASGTGDVAHGDVGRGRAIGSSGSGSSLVVPTS